MYGTKVVVVPKEERLATLAEWESIDHYRDLVSRSPINKRARAYPYIPAPETQPSSFLIVSPVPIQGPLQLVYMEGQSDGGLPHTRGTHGIALPVFDLWNPNPKTMSHEVVHLSQKQYPERWFLWYMKHWSFRQASMLERSLVPTRWIERRRLNPDRLIDEFVVWKDRYMPLSIFVNDVSPDLRYSKRGFWDLKMMQWTWEAPPGWIEQFSTGFNDEHPHEIAAHWIDGSAGVERKEFFRLNPI